jgi:hypothetical protein
MQSYRKYHRNKTTRPTTEYVGRRHFPSSTGPSFCRWHPPSSRIFFLFRLDPFFGSFLDPRLAVGSGRGRVHESRGGPRTGHDGSCPGAQQSERTRGNGRKGRKQERKRKKVTSPCRISRCRQEEKMQEEREKGKKENDSKKIEKSFASALRHQPRYLSTSTPRHLRISTPSFSSLACGLCHDFGEGDCRGKRLHTQHVKSAPAKHCCGCLGRIARPRFHGLHG